MASLLKDKLREVLQAVLPLVLLVTLLQVTLVHAPLGLFLQFLAGSALAFAGMLLLFAGIDLGILPMARFIGAELPRRGSLLLILAVTFALGFATTIAEPDVLVLAHQVEAASEKAMPAMLIAAVIGLGLALLAMLGMARVISGWSMKRLLAGAYVLALLLALLAPADVVPLAFDAGSVTTGVLSAPVVIALTIGLSAVLSGRSAVSDGFGLLGFASVGPIIAILAMGWLLS